MVKTINQHIYIYIMMYRDIDIPYIYKLLAPKLLGDFFKDFAVPLDWNWTQSWIKLL